MVDAVLAAALASLSFANVLITREVLDTQGQVIGHRLWLDLVFAIGGPSLLVLRRRFPLSIALAMTAIVLVYSELEIVEQSFIPISAMIALATAAAVGQGRWRRAVLAACLVAIAVMIAWTLLFEPIPDEFKDVSLAAAWFLVGANFIYVGGAWYLGHNIAERNARSAALLERTRELEAEREDRARRAVFDERVRIARELHDVVAHHVSVMGIQAGAARRVLDKRPDQAAEALSSIEGSSREAVTELQRILGILRTSADEDTLTPQPSLDQIESLVADVRATGMPVEIDISGPRRTLPPGVELSAFRIVQEALTNVRKHAGVASARVHLRFQPDGLEVAVEDDGRGAAADRTTSAGNGLRGMRERVDLVGGRLETGPRRSGGFQVRAWLPAEAAR